MKSTNEREENTATLLAAIIDCSQILHASHNLLLREYSVIARLSFKYRNSILAQKAKPRKMFYHCSWLN
jgi:hypothetical protein